MLKIFLLQKIFLKYLISHSDRLHLIAHRTFLKVHTLQKLYVIDSDAFKNYFPLFVLSYTAKLTILHDFHNHFKNDLINLQLQYSKDQMDLDNLIIRVKIIQKCLLVHTQDSKFNLSRPNKWNLKQSQCWDEIFC